MSWICIYCYILFYIEIKVVKCCLSASTLFWCLSVCACTFFLRFSFPLIYLYTKLSLTSLVGTNQAKQKVTQSTSDCTKSDVQYEIQFAIYWDYISSAKLSSHIVQYIFWVSRFLPEGWIFLFLLQWRIKQKEFTCGRLISNFDIQALIRRCVHFKCQKKVIIRPKGRNSHYPPRK